MPSSNSAWPDSGTTSSPWTFAATTVPPLNHGRCRRASAARRASSAPEARRVAEHLVEGDRDEVRLPGRQVEPARGHERGRVDDHVPAALLGRRDPLERVLDAGEVGLRREREQVAAAGPRVVEVALEQPVGDAQVGRLERDVRGLRALRAGELADAVDRVVVVERAPGSGRRARTGTPRRRAAARRSRSA